jgi:glycosyltransferase involved in cell wall biosynthesis
VKPAQVDVLIPTYNRPGALAVTLTGVMAQRHRDLRVVISDQSDDDRTRDDGSVQAVLRVLRARGVPVELHRHLPRRGLAEQRNFLLSQASAPYVLFLDDDIILEPTVVARLVRVLRERGGGLAGAAMVGLSHAADVRPHETTGIELWEGRVTPETIAPGTPQWERYRLHNAANAYHLAERLGATDADPVVYKVAWCAGCVLFDRAVLEEVGGFEFWRALPPEHAGEDVLAQLRVIARAGGCGVLPGGAYHQELPTTVPVRDVDAPQVLPL